MSDYATKFQDQHTSLVQAQKSNSKEMTSTVESIKKEFLLVICGGIFVAEAVSVVLQMISIRVFKKKLFRAAPLHHHLQLLGWKESKITVRLWIVAILCGVLTFLTLKLR